MRYLTTVALMIGLASAVAPVAAGAEEGATTTLRFGTHLTQRHNLTVNAVLPWMELVTKYSDGRIEFEHYPNSQMGKARDIYSLVGSGVLDAGYTLYMNRALPLMDLPSLPNLYTDVPAATLAWWEVLNKNPMKEYLAELNLKPIMPVIWNPYAISTVSAKPETLEDFGHLKLRTSGGLHDQAAAAMGITPIAISASESLEALRKGTVDGYWGSSTSLIDYQFVEVLKYAVTNLPLNGWGGMFSMNLDRFQGLSAADQQAIEKANVEMTARLAAYVDEYTSGAWDKVRDAGVETYEVSQDTVDQISALLDPITEQWIAEQDARGYPASEVVAQFREAYAKHLKK